MTKLTLIQGGKGSGEVVAKVVTLGGTNFLMPTPTPQERRQVVTLFKKSLRHQIEALANSGILTKVAVLELTAQVVEDMTEELQP